METAAFFSKAAVSSYNFSGRKSAHQFIYCDACGAGSGLITLAEVAGMAGRVIAHEAMPLTEAQGVTLGKSAGHDDCAAAAGLSCYGGYDAIYCIQNGGATQLAEQFNHCTFEGKEIFIFSVKSYGHGIALYWKFLFVQQIDHEGVPYLKCSDCFSVS